MAVMLDSMRVETKVAETGSVLVELTVENLDMTLVAE